MTTHNEPSIARRPFLRGAGVTLAALGGMTGSAVAGGRGRGRGRNDGDGQGSGNGRGGKQPLTDKPADIIVYASQIGPDTGDENSTNPNDPNEFHFPTEPGSIGIPAVAVHDPMGERSLFDFSRITMTPNGKTLHNKWLLFGGMVMASKPKPYVLLHQGNGVYESRGQVMNFEANPDIGQLPPPLTTLAGGKWHAVGTEVAKLGLANGKPDPTNPIWGATRIDFYEHKTREYTLSLLYLIGADETDFRFDGIPADAFGAGLRLITGGRLNPGGQ